MLVGHQKQWQYLKKSVELGCFSHAFLFSGPEHLGKKRVAIEFIKLLYCKNASKQACQSCRSCQDIEKGIHPDFVLIKPTGKEIQIGQIRDLHSRFSFRPHSAPLKTAVIDEAHCMNKEAQNSLLKLFEEPKGEAVLILISEYQESLLPTIVSRSEIIKFFPVSAQEIKSYLKFQGVSEEKSKDIVLFSSGKPGRAISFYLDPSKKDYQEKVIKDLSQIIKSEMAFRFQYVKKLSEDPQNIKDVLEIWLRYFRKDLISTVNAHPKDYSVVRLNKIIKTLQNTNFLISTTNVNQKLALETLMLEL